MITFKRDHSISICLPKGKLYMCEQVGASSNKPHVNLPVKDNGGDTKKMLSRDCDGCSQMKPCSRRYYVVEKGNRVYCPDGTAHLVDGL